MRKNSGIRFVAPRQLLSAGVFIGATVLCGAAPVEAVNAYIPNFSDNTVSVIDTKTATITGTIPVGNGPAGVAISPDGKLVYIINHVDGTISVINTATNMISATIAGFGSPTGIAVTPDGSRLYVCGVTNGDDPSGTISIVDTASNRVSGTIPYFGCEVVAVTPDGTRAYTEEAEIDTSTETLVNGGGFLSEYGRSSVAISPDGTRLYQDDLHFVDVFAIPLDQFLGTVDAFFAPSVRGLAVSPDSKTLYAADYWGNQIRAFDTGAYPFPSTAQIPVGNHPYGVAVTPDGGALYVPNGDGTLSVISTATNNVMATVTTAITPPGDLVPGSLASFIQPYVAQIQPPINSDGSSVFSSSRGVVPVRFSLTVDGTAKCDLPSATISLTRVSGNAASVDQSVYQTQSDNGSGYRIAGCEWMYNLNASALGPGTYKVGLSAGGISGAATFGLK